MDKSILIVEKPTLTETSANEDIWLNQSNLELATYAAQYLGYTKLSDRVAARQTDYHKKVEVFNQTNRLPKALLAAEIDTFSLDSVSKYQNTMIRQAWMKFILNPGECYMWAHVYFLTPVIATLMFLLGWLNEWQSVLLATLFQLPLARSITKELASYWKEDKGFLLWASCLALSPITSLILVVLGYGKGWSAVTFIAALFCVFCFYGEAIKQLRNTKIHWVRIPVKSYNEEIPLFVISKMRQIHELCPSAEFFVEKLEADIYLPDPFLVVTNPPVRQEFYVEVWDEPKFEAKHT